MNANLEVPEPSLPNSQRCFCAVMARSVLKLQASTHRHKIVSDYLKGIRALDVVNLLPPVLTAVASWPSFASFSFTHFSARAPLTWMEVLPLSTNVSLNGYWSGLMYPSIRSWYSSRHSVRKASNKCPLIANILYLENVSQNVISVFVYGAMATALAFGIAHLDGHVVQVCFFLESVQYM